MRPDHIIIIYVVCGYDEVFFFDICDEYSILISKEYIKIYVR